MDLSYNGDRVIITLNAYEAATLEDGRPVVASHGLSGSHSMTTITAGETELGSEAVVSSRGDLSVRLPSAALPALVENNDISGRGAERYVDGGSITVDRS